MNGTQDRDDDILLQRLRALRRDVPPEHDLWPAIAARMAAGQAPRPSARVAGPARVLAWAMAASVVLAVLLAWQHGAMRGETSRQPLIAREAQAMTRQYEAALHVITASAPDSRLDAPALQDLDRSSAQIRAALARDPDARFLLDRLQHTYSRRLALTERAALG